MNAEIDPKEMRRAFQEAEIEPKQMAYSIDEPLFFENEEYVGIASSQRVNELMENDQKFWWVFINKTTNTTVSGSITVVKWVYDTVANPFYRYVHRS